MYSAHFGLSAAPFRFMPATADLFLSTAHREGLAALEWGLFHEPSGFTLLVGETGTGKTSLVCRIVAQYHRHIRIACVTNPKLSGHEILRAILDQLGTQPNGLGKLDLLYAFQAYLDQLKPGERVAIIVDEAQDLSDDALEELRLLSNCERAAEKQLQFLLVGQPELLQRLTSPTLRQLNQRVGARAILNSLKPAEAFEYVDYLLRANGGSAKAIFRRKALRCLIEHSSGIPRLINVLCHNALVQAYSSGLRRVTHRIARTTVAEYESFLDSATPFDRPNAAEQSVPGRAPGPARRRLAALAALALPGLVAAYFWSAGTPVLLNESASQQSSPEEGYPPPANTSRASGGLAQARELGTADESNLPPAGEPIAQEEETSHSNDGPGHLVRVTPRPRSAELAAANGASQPKREIAVKSGDTLGNIAIRYLGSGSKLPRLIQANPQIDDIDLIYPGQRIYLPDPNESRQAEQLP